MSKRKRPKMTRKQKIQHDKNMELPANRFLNATDKDGNLKYETAVKLRKYYISNPDPILDAIRLANALVHEIRFHQQRAGEYLEEHTTGTVSFKNERGQLLTAEGCYIKYIAETQATHLVLSRLRQHIIEKLLVMCDGKIFTFEQFDGYVLGIEKIVKGMGFELFPDSVEVINPL